MSDLELDEPRLDNPAASHSVHQPAEISAMPSWCGCEHPIIGVKRGVLIGIKDDGRTPLVIFPGQRGSAAVAARAALDLHEAHVGREVVLMFEEGDREQPIVMACLARREGVERPNVMPGSLEVEADGERLLITAKEQMVLRCGKATITLTKDGKVLIQGTYISSRSSGVNRIKGGSVQLN
jgi:hypothetical protein